MPKKPEQLTKDGALLTALATLEDHQGCIIPPHLNAAVAREIRIALKLPTEAEQRAADLAANRTV